MADDYKIAKVPLYVGTALAHTPGDHVPADNVERNGWEDGVTSPTSKAGKELQEQLQP